jgi:hypothetical protein
MIILRITTKRFREKDHFHFKISHFFYLVHFKGNVFNVLSSLKLLDNTILQNTLNKEN